MNIEYLKKNSLTEFIEKNLGKTGVEFFGDIYEEDILNFSELKEPINKLLETILDIETINIDNNSLEIVTNKGTNKVEFKNPKTLGLIGYDADEQLLFLKNINEILTTNDFKERLVIYYDELIPDRHWIGLLNKEKSHILHNFIKNSNEEECKDFVCEGLDGPRVLGIGIADENITEYVELMIFP
ncbi:hypothetical protein HNQ02_003765 [Flavobacterium sp. 7E]|uniref:hypothetical protein n=1 Tax=Flavobacterium sp. 7E TaxID=2735898 RepID=UPI00156D5DE7|nr:hypothetical protein [Flavobacterium sp. 7E]NRS90818.1 hypothetical protein [Flavobacterium sp. 7E]